MRNAALALLLACPAAAAPAFVQEPGVRLSSGVLQAYDAAPTPNDRLYFIEDSTAVYSATTPEGAAATGEALTREAGIRLSTYTLPQLDLSSITALSMLPLNAGGLRMVYAALSSTGTLYNIFSATSADGLAWANDTGTLLTSALPVASPSLVELNTGDWRLYFAASNQVWTMLSTNEGRNFGSLTSILSPSGGVTSVSAVRRTDNLIRLYYSTGSTVLSALSSDANGTSFTAETGVRFSTPPSLGLIGAPFVVRAATESWRWRMYYNFGPTSLSTPSVYSASTFAPEVTAMTPDQLLRADFTQTFTVTGEGFAAAAPASAALDGPSGTVTGSGLTRSDDMTMTFDSSVLLLPGFYDLTVTNATGQSGTLSRALFIDVPGGGLRTIDGVFRPLQGGRARIDATVYSTGRLVMKLYTVDGRLVSTLYDAVVGEGTTSVFWDGRNAAGSVVASGLYVVHAVGPKLNLTNKIVVLK